MKKTFWEKRIPTLLGIFFIVLGIGITSLLVKQGIIFIGNAAPVFEPKNIIISNVTESSFTVSYLTSEKTVGSLNWGKSQKLGQIARDDRDQEENTLKAREIHSITVRNLSPLNTYYFSIVNGEESYLDNNIPYMVKTGAQINTPPPDQMPLTGNVVSSTGQKPEEAIVTASIEGSQLISTLLKSDGSYIIPLNSLRNKDLLSYFNYSNDQIKIEIIANDFSKSTIISSINQNPVPLVTLSKNYNFISDGEQSSPSAQTNEEQKLPTVSSEETSTSITISSPENNDVFTDNRPVFNGKALPGEKVTITIHSNEEIEIEVYADNNGNWTFRPTQQLSPGSHTITISSKDSMGATRFITRSFTVFEEGSQVIESATPSASPTITPTTAVTSTPTLTPSASPTITPTTAVTTLTPTITTAPALSPTISVSTPTPTLAPTGNASATNLTIIGFGMAIFGIILFLLARGSSIL